ncbi:aprataxin-like protein [Scaptodrosophila lebanonensis]|uniref:Aprataxin-like protein n=1 Tax=Drosophila lebanonensis TaxID=7225 RepID=A0A6J2TIA5_DROLE|nr:aprataxin-like protein [Scaptodrosophila lebanonensis]XP_030374848.1 aprataxin-like protein [Scaptodrosophila lebanonensis]XP_030374849.1 aprataxin-like protein [Scaptodrosophila lebanonensis]
MAEAGEQENLAHERGQLVRDLLEGKHIIMETDRAAVMKSVKPKAQYHFLVLPKEDIANVTALTRDHLDLLDHMEELANQAVAKYSAFPLSNFLVGFKMNQFMDRLNMHVISNDFYSPLLRGKLQWNNFNTELFLNFDYACAQLCCRGFIEPMPAKKQHELSLSAPIKCNQKGCDFSADNFFAFKPHIGFHWEQRNLQTSEQYAEALEMLEKMQLDNPTGHHRNWRSARQQPGPMIHPAQGKQYWKQRGPSGFQNQPQKLQPKQEDYSAKPQEANGNAPGSQKHTPFKQKKWKPKPKNEKKEQEQEQTASPKAGAQQKEPSATKTVEKPSEKQAES